MTRRMHRMSTSSKWSTARLSSNQGWWGVVMFGVAGLAQSRPDTPTLLPGIADALRHQTDQAIQTLK